MILNVQIRPGATAHLLAEPDPTTGASRLHTARKAIRVIHSTLKGSHNTITQARTEQPHIQTRSHMS